MHTRKELKQDTCSTYRREQRNAIKPPNQIKLDAFALLLLELVIGSRG